MQKRFSLVGQYVALAFVALAISVPAHAQTYTYSTVYDFQNNGTDPAIPKSLIIDSEGNLYGTSAGGGNQGGGTVFELTPAGGLTVLYNFIYPDIGPNSLARDSRQGNFYGTTLGLVGTVFELVKGISGSYTLSTLYSDERSQPQSVTLDPAGNLWGTDDGRCLCVFEIPAGGEWTERYITGGQPTEPQGNVLVTPAGDVYASIDYFGIAGSGYIAQVNGKTLFFPPFFYGPNSLALDPAGNIYGLAYGFQGEPGGLVFKTGTPWHTSRIYAFTGKNDGTTPSGPFALDSAGNVYGTASGGKGGTGLVFKVTPEGVESVLYNFRDTFNVLGLVMDGAGNLYGVREGGGNAGLGYVWKLTVSK
jgi:uncharacterized repeat protein (TIGR03803 family)